MGFRPNRVTLIAREGIIVINKCYNGLICLKNYFHVSIKEKEGPWIRVSKLTSAQGRRSEKWASSRSCAAAPAANGPRSSSPEISRPRLLRPLIFNGGLSMRCSVWTAPAASSRPSHWYPRLRPSSRWEIWSTFALILLWNWSYLAQFCSVVFFVSSVVFLLALNFFSFSKSNDLYNSFDPR